MVCLSYSGTIQLLDSITEDFDSEVRSWSENLKMDFLLVRQCVQRQIFQYSSRLNSLCFLAQGGNETETGRVPAFHAAFSPVAHSLVPSDNQTPDMTADKTSVHIQDSISTGEQSIDMTENNDNNQGTDMTHNLTLVTQTDDRTIELQSGRPVQQPEVTESTSGDHERPWHAQDSSGSSTTSQPCSTLSEICELDMEPSQRDWCGFKLVGDNLDKNVRPSFQRVDHQTKSFHHFHAIAVRDRTDLSALSNSVPAGQPIDMSKFLLSVDDVSLLERDFEVLLSRFSPFLFVDNTGCCCCFEVRILYLMCLL